MTRDAIRSLPDYQLAALIRSTKADGRYWLERVWAMDEAAKRAAASYRVLQDDCTFY